MRRMACAHAPAPNISDNRHPSMWHHLGSPIPPRALRRGVTWSHDRKLNTSRPLIRPGKVCASHKRNVCACRCTPLRSSPSHHPTRLIRRSSRAMPPSAQLYTHRYTHDHNHGRQCGDVGPVRRTAAASVGRTHAATAGSTGSAAGAGASPSSWMPSTSLR